MYDFIRDLTSIKSRIPGFYRPNRFFLMLMAKTDFGFPLPIDPLIVKTANMPGREVGEIILSDAGIDYSIAAEPTFNDLVITIRTWHYMDYRLIQSWFDSIHNPINGTKNKPLQYKTEATIGQVGDNGITSEMPLHNLRLYGVYPKSIDDISFDTSEAGEVVTFTVTLNVDKIKMY